MYIRRTLSKSGKRRKKYYTYRLVESYRIADKVRQRTLLSLGSDFNLPKEQWAHLTSRIEDILLGRNALLEADKNIEVIAQSCASKIIDKRSIASGDGDARYTPVDIDAIETLRSRSIGNETILKESMDELDLPSLFDRLGFSSKQKKSLLGLLMAKAISPGSERSMHEWLRYNSAAGELLECDYDKISLSSLYRSTDLIKVYKEEIEHHLYTKQKGLLGFEESITLFDLTNSYFEGEAKGIDKAHRGRSKDEVPLEGKKEVMPPWSHSLWYSMATVLSGILISMRVIYPKPPPSRRCSVPLTMAVKRIRFSLPFSNRLS